MAKRKQRTDEHRRADVGAKHVQLICAKAGYVSSVGEPGSDYGIDVVVNTFDDQGFVENEEFKIQVKSPAAVEHSAGGKLIAYPIRKRDLHHWLAEIVPVILVVYDSQSEVAYWVYVQRYFEQEVGFSLKNVKMQVTIRLKKADVFDVAAVKTIRDFKNAVLAQVGGKVSHV